MNDTNLYQHQHCFLFVPSHNDSLSIKNECILSFCVEHFFIASSLTSKAVDFTALSFIAVVVRLFWKAIRISSNHGWIPSCCHIKALLASIANLKNKKYDKRFSFQVLPIQKNSLWVLCFYLFFLHPNSWNMEHFHYNDVALYCLENWDTIECIVGWNQDNLHRGQIQDAAEFQAWSTFKKI